MVKKIPCRRYTKGGNAKCDFFVDINRDYHADLQLSRNYSSPVLKNELRFDAGGLEEF